MEVIPYEPDDYDYFMNSIVMIPEKDNNMNGFYKIVKSTNIFFFVKKIKSETKILESNKYEAIISSDFENDTYKKIKKTSVNKKYPVIFTSVVQYEV